VILVILNSCVTQKQVRYLQRKQQNDTTLSYRNQRTSDYKIQPHDNLYIRIFNLDEKSYLFFNRQSSITNSLTSEYTDAALYLDSYVVNDSGYIDFPLIGKIFMKDLAIDQAKNMMQSLINEYLKDVTVTVKLVSFNITILGEVKMPGTRKVLQDKVNIFEAISLAGDLSEYANRHKVAYLDLNSIDILSSPYYYLEPNDILYISPLGIKQWSASTFPWTLVLSAISTTVLLIYYFK
jgi:polysaccharide export outer membrane protein